MSIKVMSYVWDHSPHTGSDLLMLLAIADHANDQGWAWPSIPTLAKKCRLHTRQAIYCIRKLEKAGSITIKKGGGRGRASRYRINSAPGCTFYGETVHQSAPIEGNSAVECTVSEETVHQSAPLPEECRNSDKIKGAFHGKNSALECTPTIIDPSEDLNPKDPPIVPVGDDGGILENLPAVEEEKKTRPQPTYSPGFLQFWAIYPPSRRASKPSCLKLWRKGHLESRTEEVCAKVEGLKHTVWHGKEPHFIPMTLTWLSQGRYDDDPHTPAGRPALWAWARDLEEQQHATE